MSAQPQVSTDGRFRPHPWLAGGHRQTLLAHLLRKRLRWPHPTEDIVVDAEGGARLLLRASWQPGPRVSRPALVIVHGLGGSDSSSYVVSTGRLAFARGWHVVRMNMRGSGDGESLCPLLYNAGLDGDLLSTLEAVAGLVPRQAVVGFSLGANLALLAVSRGRDRLPGSVAGLAAISPPLDLSACADALERWDNQIYQRYFMVLLRDAYRRRHQRRPDLFPSGLEVGLRTVREYDDRITAPFGGYKSATDYYTRSSAGPHLNSITLPTLVLSATDDPMIPVDSVGPWAASKSVRREITATGGHVGFVARASAPGFFWAPERALDFLESHGVPAGAAAAAAGLRRGT
jgi:predicted alpha/beta-fold hydrolase